MTAAAEKRTPDESARCIAKNAIPDVTEALELMKLRGHVEVGDVQDGHGTVLISLLSGDAYEFARWVRMRAPRREASGRSHG
ncbi:hypothetical protein ACFWVU_03840 [Streptomyces sp. NPDC058686]|uniref:hypothetical protein n=1 Tax=Streptomyces sp. NPDC058686 TaxID=3346599 RepID=UPI00364B3921